MTAPNPLGSLLIPSCPALEASEVARKLKLATYNRAYYEAHRESVMATSKAWRKANPDKVAQYWRTYVERVKPAPVEVTLSELVQQVADLKALVLQLVIDKQQSIAITGKSLVITKPAPPPVSNR